VLASTSIDGFITLSNFKGFGQPQQQLQQQQQQQQQNTSIFGATNTTGGSSLLESQQTSAFQAAHQTSLFGQTATTNTPGGLFGGTATSGFGQPAANQQGGTAIAEFQAPQETETLMKGSTQSYVQTKQQCITFMKEYSDKSLEELRIEDYAANRKEPQAGTGLFGGAQQNGVFGPTQQPATAALFRSQQPAGTSTVSTGFGAAQPSTSTSGIVKLRNPNIELMDQDILYHLALGSGSHDLEEMFGDVRVSFQR
jgi:nuclear pore complex protein Nup98-Nup96